jgi:hypothetical protein
METGPSIDAKEDAMNKLFYIGLTLSCVFPLLLSEACLSQGNSEDYFHSTIVPQSIIFEGITYKNAMDIIATESLPNKVSFIGEAYLNAPPSPISSCEMTSATFEVYSIKGFDKNKSVAIRIPLIGEKEQTYYYFKYDSKLP